MSFNKKTKDLIERIKFRIPDLAMENIDLEEIRAKNLAYEQEVIEGQKITDQTLSKHFTI
jgi:hypothetical protein